MRLLFIYSINIYIYNLLLIDTKKSPATLKQNLQRSHLYAPLLWFYSYWQVDQLPRSLAASGWSNITRRQAAAPISTCATPDGKRGHDLRPKKPMEVCIRDRQNDSQVAALLMEQIRLTSWYGKYSMYLRGFIYTCQVVQDFFKRQYVSPSRTLRVKGHSLWQWDSYKY